LKRCQDSSLTAHQNARALHALCLEADDECVPLDCCVDAGNLDGDVIDVVVNLGLSGDVGVDLCDDVLMEDGLAFLRKTRAGGNWLTGGIVTGA
jgi:hypothetical protein